MRECGECTWCCYFMASKELNLVVGEQCTHCTTDGCSVYSTRHDICRSFKCVWLQQPQIPDSFRPDKSGLLVEMPGACNTYIAFVIPEVAGDVSTNSYISTFIQKINESGHSIVVHDLAKDVSFCSLAEGDTNASVQADLQKSYNAHKVKGLI